MINVEWPEQLVFRVPALVGQSELGCRPVSGVGPRLRGGFEKARVALGAPNDEVSEMNILGVFV